MKRSIASRIIAVACVGALSTLALSGCASVEQSTEEAQAQAENREYMSAVNATMEQLGERLQGFDDAVARGDAVTMRTQADNAFKVLDSLSELEAPEVLKDIRQGYLDGCASLEEALNAYIDLYTEVTNGGMGDSEYQERLAKVQEAYNAGVEKLKAADEAASAL